MHCLSMPLFLNCKLKKYQHIKKLGFLCSWMVFDFNVYKKLSFACLNFQMLLMIILFIIYCILMYCKYVDINQRSVNNFISLNIQHISVNSCKILDVLTSQESNNLLNWHQSSLCEKIFKNVYDYR